MRDGKKLIILGLLATFVARTALGQSTARVSVESSGTQGDGLSIAPCISADGRFVAFTSYAANLVPGDTNGVQDVFVHDRQFALTTRVSVDSSGVQGNAPTYVFSISDNGRFLAFSSEASNLVPDDTNGHGDAFVHDRQTAQTLRVSVDSSGVQGNGPTYGAWVSADGSFVVFSSSASNLVSDDTNGIADVFVHDRHTGQTTRVSISSSGAQGTGHPASIPYPCSISADGHYVAFGADMSNLVAGDTNERWDCFVHDQQTGQTTRVSVNSSGTQGNHHSEWPSITPDGRYVAFFSEASNLVPLDTNNLQDVFVHDRQTGQTTRASVNSSGVQSDFSHSYYSSISADGRYVAFNSGSSLITGDTNGHEDVFVHDRHTGQTICASLGVSGTTGNGQSYYTSISSTGRYVAFQSYATDLVSGDTNRQGDVFVRDLAAAPDDVVDNYGFVYLGNTSLPLKRVTVQVFDDPTQPPIVTVTTNADGMYVIEGLTGEHRIKALLEYDEPGTSPPKHHVIANYPVDGFDTVVELGAGSPEHLPDIVFEWPIILQAGWWGPRAELQALVWNLPPYSPIGGGGVHAWDYAVGAGAAEGLLTADPGDPMSPHYRFKHGHGIPAFLCFRVPKLSEDPDGYNPTAHANHDANGQVLTQWIEQRVKPTLSTAPSDYVDPFYLDRLRFSVMSHSMGAVITRAMVAQGDHPSVNRIVSMDGVHGGASLQNLTFGLWNLSESYMNGFGAPFYYLPPLIPGWNDERTSDVDHPERWLLFSCDGGVLTPDYSAFGQGRIFLLPLLGWWQFLRYWVDTWVIGTHRLVSDSHEGVHDSQDRLGEGAAFLMGTALDGSAAVSAFNPARPSGGGKLSGLVSATANTTASASIPFDSNIRVRARFLRGGTGAQYVLKDPNGVTIPLQSFTSNAIDPSSSLDLFVVANPPIGTITLELTAASDAAVISWSFDFDNGRHVVLQASPRTIPMGQSLQFVASLQDIAESVISGAGTVCTATVGLPGGGSTAVPMYDDGQHNDGAAGDDMFGGDFLAPATAGRCSVECSITTTLASETVSRNESSVVAVLPGGIAIVGAPAETTPDANNDGLLDSLVFTQTISLASPRTVALSARLEDDQGNLIHPTRAELLNPPSGGSYQLTLTVPGSEIVRHAQNGPWRLAEITLYDLDAGSLPGATTLDHTTQAWVASDFEPPPWPRISHLSADTGPTAGGNHVILHGSGFQDTTSVLFETEQAEFVVTGNGTIDITVPPRSMSGGSGGQHPLGNSIVDIRVETRWGVAVASRAYTYSRLTPR